MLFRSMQKRFSSVTAILRKKLRDKQFVSYNLHYRVGLYPEGNELYDLFIHPIDLVTFLFGDAKILGVHKTNSKNGGRTYLLMLAHNHIAGTLELSTSYSWREAHEAICINTESGMYDMQQMETLTFTPSSLSFGKIPFEKVYTRNSCMTSLYSRNFLRSVEHKNAFGLCSVGMDNRRTDILDGRPLLCRIRGDDAPCWRNVRLYE